MLSVHSLAERLNAWDPSLVYKQSPRPSAHTRQRHRVPHSGGGDSYRVHGDQRLHSSTQSDDHPFAPKAHAMASNPFVTPDKRLYPSLPLPPAPAAVSAPSRDRHSTKHLLTATFDIGTGFSGYAFGFNQQPLTIRTNTVWGVSM